MAAGQWVRLLANKAVRSDQGMRRVRERSFDYLHVTLDEMMFTRVAPSVVTRIRVDCVADDDLERGWPSVKVPVPVKAPADELKSTSQIGVAAVPLRFVTWTSAKTWLAPSGVRLSIVA